MNGAADSLERWLASAARRRSAAFLERKRHVLRPLDAVRVHDGELELLNFSSNDYLGLAGHPDLRAAAAEAAHEFGSGSGASALVTGYRPQHQQLEDGLAEFLDREAALLFSSGYLANLAVATSLAGRGDRIVQDRLCHASLIDAARLSGARLARYRHADMGSLEQQLGDASSGHTLIVTDGVFSMDGDIAPLSELSAQAQASDAWLVVDDAHGIGVIGSGGRGLVAEAGLNQARVPVLVGTLGKAFGSAGAFVAGSRGLVEHLVNEARSYLFTTAMPPAVAAAGLAGLAHVRDDQWRREHLAERVSQFREGAQQRGLDLMPSHTAIQPLVLGGEKAALDLAGRLRERGFLVAAIRPPTVPPGTARLRVTLSAAHTHEHVESLLEAIESCLDGR